MSLFSITAVDITPDPVPSEIYAALLRNPQTGVADTTIAAVVDKAEAEFVSHLGGMFTAAANIALAKPQVLFVVVYWLHFRKAQDLNYQIPAGVVAAWKAALAWADGTGQALLSAEGSTAPALSGNVEYDAPAAKFTMDQQDLM